MNLLILFGSETGNAEELSYAFHQLIEEKCENIVVQNMNYFSDNYEELNNYDYVIIFCSTTGNGDFPNNASKFWRKIKNRQLEKNTFESLKYSICALGDSNYSMFCFSGKNLNKRLEQLGATPITPIFCMDAVDDDEESFEKYVSMILPKLI